MPKRNCKGSVSVRKVWKAFEMGSSAGIGLLMVSTVCMLWYSQITGKPIPDGTATLILGIFAAKTSHGIFTQPKGTESNDTKN